MKPVFVYIQEKLIIKKNNYKPPRELPTTGVDTTEISKIISSQSLAKSKSHHDKIEMYKNKGSNPKRLVKSIKDKTKLICRWYYSILLNWIECALVFRDEIINRGYATEDELDVFILNKYYNVFILNRYNNQKKIKPIIEEYLDEIGVKYE